MARVNPPTATVAAQQARRNRRLATYGKLFALVLYLFFARFLERTHLVQTPPQIWLNLVRPFVLLEVLNPVATVLGQFLHPRVLRHFIPLAAGWWTARLAALALLQRLYDLESRQAASEMLARFTGLAGKPIPIKRDTLAQDQEKHHMLRIGGPGAIAVQAGDVVVTEWNGRFSRLLGPGNHLLAPFEQVRFALDLRQHDRDEEQVTVQTKDGMELSTNLGVTFRIDSGDLVASKANPFPFVEAAARQAAYAITVLEAGISGWDSLPLPLAAGKLRAAMNDYTLDDMLPATDSPDEPYSQVRRRLESGLRQELPKFGIKLLGVRLGPLQPPAEVTSYRIDYWRARREYERRQQESEGKAEALKRVEAALTEARVRLVDAVAEAIQQARQEGNMARLNDLVVLRLIDALEETARHASAAAARKEAEKDKAQPVAKEKVEP